MECYTSLDSGSNILSTGSPVISAIFCLQLIFTVCFFFFLFYLQRANLFQCYSGVSD